MSRRGIALFNWHVEHHKITPFLPELADELPVTDDQKNIPQLDRLIHDGPIHRDAITPTEQPTRLHAFVVSTSGGDAAALEAAVTAQAAHQLGLHVKPLLTLTEKRATFACTPGLNRPPGAIAPGLFACGDYVAGPYPATLEGAVRSGLQAADALR